MKVGIVCSEFHKSLVERLYKGANAVFLKQSVKVDVIKWVPGAGEIPQASNWFITNYKLDGLLGLGVIIRGETSHYESLCRILEQGLINLQTCFSTPVVFSVLMVENHLQAENRLGGSKGHRGEEAALTLIKMIKLKNSLPKL